MTVSWVTTGASASQFGVFVDDALITTGMPHPVPVLRPLLVPFSRTPPILCSLFLSLLLLSSYSFTVAVAGVSSYELAVSSLAPGKHYINVTALDASTPYPLSMLEWDDGTQAVHPSAVVDVLKL